MLQPLQDKVVLKVKKEEEVTKGGIILSSNSKNKALVATVIAVGPGTMSDGVRIVSEVKEKDNVFIQKGAGIEIEYEDEEYLVVTQEEILVVIK